MPSTPARPRFRPGVLAGVLLLMPAIAGARVGQILAPDPLWREAIEVQADIEYARARDIGLTLDFYRPKAGGHLAALLGTSGDVDELEGTLGTTGVSSRVAGVVAYCGPADFAVFGVDSARLNRPGQSVYKLFGGPVQEKRDAARAASPVSHVSRDDPPFLLVHGTNDQVVPVDQSRRLHRALHAAGCDVTLVEVEGAGHVVFTKPEDYVRLHAFFGRHLLGRKSP